MYIILQFLVDLRTLATNSNELKLKAKSPKSTNNDNSIRPKMLSANSSSVPAFLAKLWRLVDDPHTNHLIFWSKVSKLILI